MLPVQPEGAELLNQAHRARCPSDCGPRGFRGVRVRPSAETGTRPALPLNEGDTMKFAYTQSVRHQERRMSGLGLILAPLARELDYLSPEGLILEAQALGGLVGYVLAPEAARQRGKS